MTTVAATDLKNKCGQIMNHAEFVRLQRMEDAYWVEKAEVAIQSGFLTAEETFARLKGDSDSEDEE